MPQQLRFARDFLDNDQLSDAVQTCLLRFSSALGRPGQVGNAGHVCFVTRAGLAALGNQAVATPPADLKAELDALSVVLSEMQDIAHSASQSARPLESPRDSTLWGFFLAPR